jgi:hypothetical protein
MTIKLLQNIGFLAIGIGLMITPIAAAETCDWIEREGIKSCKTCFRECRATNQASDPACAGLCCVHLFGSPT